MDHPATHSVDGDISTYYESDTSESEWLAVYLERSVKSFHIEIKNREDYAMGSGKDEDLQLSVYIVYNEAEVTDCKTFTKTENVYRVNCAGSGNGIKLKMLTNLKLSAAEISIFEVKTLSK